ncbi:MAG: MFS transporter [Proteobacteria bacterium]|nr:MFS transporter [Pseudomonadota bacterium]
MEETIQIQSIDKTSKTDETPANSEQEASAWKQPGLGVKMSYAAPYFAVSALAAPLVIELKIFYTDTILVPAGLLALAMAIARALDAITDPVMGWITDHTRSRWGRRKPWIVLGLPLCMLFFWLMFSPPASLSADGGAVLWAGATFCLYYLFHTIWNVPYQGLGLELTPDYDDRTNVFGYRAILGGIGLILCFFVIYYLKSRHVFADERQMLKTLTGFLALITILMFVIPLLGVKEHPEFARRKRSPLIPGIRRALRNRPFRILLAVSIIGTVPATVPFLLMPYFTKYVIGAEDRWRIIFGVIYIVAAVIAIPVWMVAARRIGKLPVWVMAACIGIGTSCVMFTLGQGQTTLMFIMEFMRGFGTGSIAILFPAMLADVVDYDELRTGKRREAQFGSFLNLVPKFVAIVGATVPLAILGATGYDPSMTGLSSQSVLAIRFLYALFPVLFHILGVFVILRYPINRKVHQAIRDGIESHQRGEQAHDPVTGQTRSPIHAQSVDEETGWFLDYFSLRELRRIVEKGADGLVGQVLTPSLRAALICAGSVGTSVWLLIGSLSRSQEDQFRQGLAACMVVVAGLAFTVVLFHLMRLQAAAKMTTEPVDTQTIREHINNL